LYVTKHLFNILVIKNKEEEEFATKVKFIALIQDNEFQRALSLAESNAALKEYKFEVAYCLYRIGNLDEAMQKLEGSKGESADHLRAQIVNNISYSNFLGI
jgi:hypothetical protein